MDGIERIIRENCWKFDKGYPDSKEDMDYLKTLIEQEVEIDKSIVPGDKDGVEQDKVANAVKNYSTDDIVGLFQSLDLDQAQLNKLFNRVNNFKAYRPIKKDITKAGWNPKVLKKFTREIQDLIEDLNAEEKIKFIKYLEGDKIDFPSNEGSGLSGKLNNTLASTGVPVSVVNKIITHTSQDEGKRGVGMGEIGLTLLFNNVDSSGGKGDLAIDNEEFEIKGNGAVLGDKPFNLITPFNEKLGKYGIEVKGGSGGITFDGEKFAMTQLDQVLVKAYNATKDKEGFKNAFKNILIDDNKLGGEAVNARFNNIDFTDSESFNTEIGLMNFIRYAQKEGFKHFMVHDYGAGGPNTGAYIYVSGTGTSMADQLKANGVKFENISPTILRPRVGFGGKQKYKEE